MMIDTIGLRFSISLDPATVHAWGEKSHKRAKGGGYFFRLFQAISDKGAPVNYNYYPYANGGSPFLYVEFSLPHLVLGSNVYMLFNFRDTVDLANGMLPDVASIPKLDLWDGILTRLDVC